MSRLGCRRGCAGAPPARRDATAAACVVSLTSPARASASQTRASPFPGAITGTAAAAPRAAPAASGPPRYHPNPSTKHLSESAAQTVY